MIQRFARDESGMAMGLAVMMILLIGVMGAGLLTFVMRDLDAVIEVNRGQRALDIADAGVQAAKAHLRVDSFREHYDTNRENDCAEGLRIGNDNWSKAIQGWTSVDTPGACETTIDNPVDDPDTPWPEQYGVTKLFAGGRFHVTIECYDQSGDEAISPDPCDGGAAGAAPEANALASDRKFFKITSTGYDTPTGDGAVRKIEAIYYTQKRTYAPIAYWTPKNIDFSGTKCVKRISFFAGENISNVQPGTSACGPNGFIADRATPALYTDWYYPPYNTTRRVDASGNPVIGAGFGAVGRVCGKQQCTSNSDSVADGYQDFDVTTGGKGRNITFVASAPNPTPATQITFPFEEGNALADPSTIVEPGLVEEMAAAAGDQGNYHSATGTWKIDTTDWPAEGGKSIVYFVDGVPEVSVDFRVNTGKNQPLAKGVIIVRNGNFEFNNSSNGFEGVIIVIGNGTTTGLYKQAGGIQLDGYVAASSNMTISGNVEPSTTIDYTNLNSFYDVSLWSWRELYQ